MSLSHHAEPLATTEETGDDGQPQAFHGYTEDVSRLSSLCPQLRALELHWYKIDHRAHAQGESLLADIVSLDEFPRLQNCGLFGILTNERALPSLLAKLPQLSHFEMEEIMITSGKFRPVLDYLTGCLPNLIYLHLEDLWETG